MLLPSDTIAQRRRVVEGYMRSAARQVAQVPLSGGPMVITVGTPDGLRLLSSGWMRVPGDSALRADELLSGGYPVEST